MNRLGKYVNALFLLAAAVAWLVTSHYTTTAIGYFQLARKIGGGATEAMTHILPLLVAVGVFAGLRANAKATEFSTDAIDELTKVSWPTQKDVRLGTIVVIITVLLAGVFFGIVDTVFTAVVRAILSA